jgi:hypothetical protein
VSFLQAMMHKCNYCVWRDMQKDHGTHGTFPDDKLRVEVDPHLPGFPDGVRIMCMGEEIGWFAKLPEECHC